MRKLRVLAATLAVVMAGSLVACGGGASSSGSSSSGSEASDAAASEEGGAVAKDGVITYWNVAVEGADKAITEAAIEAYNEQYAAETGYTIEHTAIQNDKYKEKIVIAMSSGQCPDMYSNWSGGPLAEYKNSGFAKPVTEQFKAEGLDEILLDSGIAQGTIDGDIYGVPHLNISIAGVYYNKNIFAEVGVDVPKTISELEAVCDKLKAAGYTPFVLGNSTKWQGSMFYMAFATRYAGAQPVKDAYAGTGSFEDECFIYAGNKVLEWADKGYFQEACNSVSTDDGQDKQLLYQGQGVMMNSGSWMSGTFISDNADWFHENIAWFPFPECDEVANGAEYAKVCNGTVGDQFVTFNCEGDKLDAAMKLMACYLSPEGIQIAVDNGKIPPIKGVESYMTEEVNKQICDFANSATDVQLWYDQYLPAAVANAHLDNSQLLFDGTAGGMTAEKCAEETQKAMAEYLADN